MANRGGAITDTAKAFERWRSDPCAFITEVLRDPETGQPFELFPGQAEFIRHAYTLTPEGRLPYADAIYSAPKKNGKSTTGAMLALYSAVVVGGPPTAAATGFARRSRARR
jgi:hypothetical protein